MRPWECPALHGDIQASAGTCHWPVAPSRQMDDDATIEQCGSIRCSRIRTSFLVEVQYPAKGRSRSGLRHMPCRLHGCGWDGKAA
jgi:hypothetical protein